MPMELINIVNLFKDNYLLYLILFIILFYLLVSLFTWSLKKPLLYLGISNIVSGLIIIVIRILLNFIGSFLPNYISIIDIILPSILKPILVSGIVITLIGIIMLIINYLLNKSKRVYE